jgi:hypothetical protein
MRRPRPNTSLIKQLSAIQDLDRDVVVLQDGAIARAIERAGYRGRFLDLPLHIRTRVLADATLDGDQWA